MAGVAPAVPRLTFTDASGAPLAGGSVTVYLAGTTTKTLVYQDSDLTILHTNPVLLDASGSAVFWLTPGLSYKLLVRNALGQTIPGWPVDDIQGSGASEVSIQQTTVDRFSGDGADTTFTLSVTPAHENDVDVYVGGVYQSKTAYSLAGTTLTFAVAPVLGTDNIEVVSRVLLDYGTFATPLIALADEATDAAQAAALSHAGAVASATAADTSADEAAASAASIVGAEAAAAASAAAADVSEAAAATHAAGAQSAENTASAIVLGNFQQTGSSVSRPYTGRFKDTVNILDFIDPIHYADIAARVSVLDCYPAWLEAYNAITYGTIPYYRSGPAVYFPPGLFNMSAPWQLKKSMRWWGDGSGMATASTATIVFPAGSTGIIVHRYNTIGATTEAASTAGDASIIEGLQFYSSYAAADTIGGHGVWLRGRAIVRHNIFSGFVGDGIRVVATAGGAANVEGNANCFQVYGNRCQSNGEWGINAQGADANAGKIDSNDCSNNGSGGFLDNSFLGNTQVANHTSNNGAANSGYNIQRARTSMVYFGGQRYNAKWGATAAQLVATTPGTDSNIWIPGVASAGASATHPLWLAAQPEGTYFASAQYATTNVNGRNVLVGPYQEGGYSGSILSSSTLRLGGAMDDCVGGGQITVSGGNILMNTKIKPTTIEPSTGYNLLDTSGLFTYEFKSTVTGRYSWHWANVERILFTLLDRNATVANGYARPVDATAPGGNSASLLIGSHYEGAINQMFWTDYGTAAPTTGAWRVNDRRKNTAPAAGAPPGWICTVAGSPGTWLPEPNLPGDRATNVTQTTNKSTAVTTTKRAGTVQLAVTSLAAGETFSFTMNNTLIGANDNVLVHRKSGGTALSYEFFVDSVAAGSAVIKGKNISAVPLGEAVVLQYTIFS